MVITWMSLYIGAALYVYIARAIILVIMAYNITKI